jgi:AcrR family transcriptional regulator
MPHKTKKATPPELGRKGASVMRNRVALLRSTHEVLASKGQSATIEDIAEHAQMAVSTIYKHFKDKDVLIAATISHGFGEWEKWAESFVKDSSDPLERLVLPMRLFARLHVTHPHHAQTLLNYFKIATQTVPILQTNFPKIVEELTKAKILTIENPDLVARNIQGVMIFTVIHQVLNPDTTEAEIDSSIRAALSMLGISEAEARRLTESKLPKLKG